MTTIADPLVLPCGLALANRIEKAATSEGLATEHGHPTRHHAALYGRWASGGAGLSVTGNVMVDRSHVAARGEVVLDETSPLEPFRRWAAASLSRGVPMLMQLSHPGRQALRSVDRAPVAPSAVAIRTAGFAFAAPRSLEPGEIHDIVRRFSRAAELAESAGFSGVQLHAGHGYLLHQFLSPRTNRRSDEWGGTAEGRRRLLGAVLRAVRARVSAGFAVSVKLNAPEDETDDLEVADVLETMRMVADEGGDLIELSGGTFEREPVLARRARDGDDGLFGSFAARARREVGTPLSLTGGFRDGRTVWRAVASGLTDLVGLARWSIVAPEVPRALLEGAGATRLEHEPRLDVPWIGAAATLTWYEQELRRLSRGARSTAARPRLSLIGTLRRMLV